MVLLTSSSISVAISSAVVCIFTFLLFLSGYVLQQQSVRSIQAVLHAPPAPTPTLPVYFQDITNDTTYARERETALEFSATEVADDNDPAVNLAENSSRDGRGAAGKEQVSGNRRLQTAITGNDLTPTVPSEIVIQGEQVPLQPEAVLGSATALDNPVPPADEGPDRGFETQSGRQSPQLAYIQVISKPSHICSALLFYQLQREHGARSTSSVLLYPSSWEEDVSDEAVANVLALIHIAKDELDIKPRAVKIDDNTLAEAEIEKQMVAALSTIEWEYERLLYLRIPGLALNIGALDSALETFGAPSSSRSWIQSPWNAETPAQPPSVLIVSSTGGVFSPRGSMRRLISEAVTSHANHHETEMDVEAAANTAAYVHFDEGELEHRRVEKEWYGGVFERYERGRAEVCSGISFEENKDQKKLRAKRKRG